MTKDESVKTVWLMAARRSHVKLSQKLWDWAKELQLNLAKQFGQIVWLVAVAGGHVEVLGRLWSGAKKELIKQENLNDNFSYMNIGTEVSLGS